MKGIVFIEKGKAAIQDEPVPECKPDGLLCKAVFTGLTNGTERNVLMGGNYSSKKWPVKYGYQNVGEIIEAGKDVKGWKAGDVIFSGEFCLHRAFFPAPAKPGSLIVKVPKKVRQEDAALFGVASVAFHDVRRAEIKKDEKVLVVGAGPIGQFTAQAARLAGGNVTVADLNKERLDIALKLGARQVIVPDAAWDNVKAAGPFDCVIEDSGAKVLDHIIGPDWWKGIMKYRSRVVLIAGRKRVDYSFNAAQGYELSILHAGHFTPEDLKDLAALVASGKLLIGPVIKDIVKFTDAVKIYDRLRDDPGSLFGVVFDWRTEA
jgi:2-desacetyl-2-hydroxyethyl bacteriochlorophyllide A dehydrogenase